MVAERPPLRKGDPSQSSGTGREPDFIVPGWVQQAAANLGVDLVAAEVIRALREGGISSILLKGPVTVRYLYEGEPPRSYVDVDLLLPPPEGRAEAVFRRLGFDQLVDPVPHDWPRHSMEWVRPSGGASLDVHRTFYGIEVADEVAWDVLSRETERMLVAGTEVEVPSEPGHALVIALHAASHGTRLKSLEDLGRALTRFEAKTWLAAARLAAELGATRAFSVGLRLHPKGALLANQLGLPRRDSVASVIRADGRTRGALGLERLSSLRGLPKVIFAARMLVPPKSWVRVWASQDPRRPSNLALAYVARLGFLARILPGAFRAWVRARRQVRRR